MPRIDVWDKHRAQNSRVDCGYPRDLQDLYELRDVLGQGGFGKVRVAVSRVTGREFACKSIPKTVDVPGISPGAQAAHLANVEKEVRVLRRLQGTLSVVHLESVHEDPDHVHIVMEYCRGGELLHHLSHVPHYSESTAAEIIRDVMRTLLQCHANNILHRDIKPGNFMLRDAPEDLRRARQQHIKGIDFGLAVFFDPNNLPRTDLGLEGTPWYMAPEVLNSQYYPASDVWSAGVMAYQLLTGRLPFDDRRNPSQPALSRVWKSILSDPLPVSSKPWQALSPEAQDFVSRLLHRDPQQRPTAKEALTHPWLALEGPRKLSQMKPLAETVVQRLQHYAVGVAHGNALRQSIFELIAQELLSHELASPMVSAHGGVIPTTLTPIPSLSAEEDLAYGETPWRDPGGTLLDCASLEEVTRAGTMSAYGGLQSARSPADGEGWEELRMRSCSLEPEPSYWSIMRAALAAGSLSAGAGESGMSYVRTIPRSAADRAGQLAASRLALDTATAKEDSFRRFLAQLQRPSPSPAEHGASASSGNVGAAPAQGAADGGLQKGTRSDAAGTGTAAKNGNGEASLGNGHAPGSRPGAGPRNGPAERLANYGVPKKVNLKELREVMKCLNFSREAEAATVDAVAKGLSQLGYDLAPGEVRTLTRSVSSNRGEKLSKASFFASQMDWGSLQTQHKELWLAACKRVFEELDSNNDKALRSEDLVKHLREKLPQSEIDSAMEDALHAAGYADAENLDFEGFLRLASHETPLQQADLEYYNSRILD